VGSRVRMLVAVLALGAGMLATTGVAAAGDWSLFEEAVPHRAGAEPQVAMAPDGEAVVVAWDFQTIRAWRHTPEGWAAAGAFGELVSPEEGICCRDPEAPDVAIDPAGDIFVVWQEEIGNSGEVGVYDSVRPRGGSFSAPALIGPGSRPVVAVDAAGEVTAAWLLDDGTSTVVEAATAPPGGSFSSPVALSGDGRDASELRLVEDPRGDAVATWTRNHEGAPTFEAAVRPAGGAFTEPDAEGDGDVLGEVATTAPPAEPAQEVAIDAAGEAVATWEAPDGGVRVARRGVGAASFGGATTLGTTAASPSVAIDEAGEAVADWPVSGGIDVSTAAPGGAFGPPEGVTTYGSPTFARAAVAPDGSVALAWLTNFADAPFSPGGPGISEGGSLRPPGGSFAAADSGGSAGGGMEGATSLRVTGDAAGDALAIWGEATSLGPQVRGFVYDAGPKIAGVTAPTTARVGEPVTFAMPQPSSTWSPFFGTTWSFGDGSTASGLTASHAYARPGIYTVTASAADAQPIEPGLPERHVENSVTRTITVTPAPASPTRPRLTGVRETHKVWREPGPRGHRGGAPVGTTFRFSLSARARVRFAFTRLRACRSHARRHHGCAATAPAGSLTKAAGAGVGALAFRGRLSAKHRLAPGRYSVRIAARDGAGRSKATTLRFSIVG
jgi:hypothetical protein